MFNSEGTTATRTRAPWYTAVSGSDPTATLKCAVVPLKIARQRLSRERRQFEYGIGIDLQKTVTPTDDDTLTALSTAAEQIHDWFDDGHKLTGLTDWICLSAEREDVYFLDALYAEKLWETLITVSVRGYRS